jgi:predicted transposase YdaD
MQGTWGTGLNFDQDERFLPQPRIPIVVIARLVEVIGFSGLQRAKAHGRVSGRPPTEDDNRTMAHLTALRRGGASIRRMANELGLSKTTVARLVKEQAALAR